MESRCILPVLELPADEREYCQHSAWNGHLTFGAVPCVVCEFFPTEAVFAASCSVINAVS